VPMIFLGVVLCGCGIGPMTAAGSLVAATWIAALLLLIGVQRRSRTEWPAGPVIQERSLWLKACLPVVFIDGAFLLMTSTDILALTVFHSDAEVGIYSAAARLVALVAFVHHGFTWASGHHFTALHQAGDRAALAGFATRTTVWTFLPSVAAAAVMAMAAPWLLMLFGKDFAAGGMVTVVLLAGLLARAAVGPAEQLLIMTYNQMACVKAYGLAFVINLLFCLVLVPRYGGMGAAAATAGAYVFASVIVAMEVRRRLGFHMNIVHALWPARQAAHA
jgi:O-antigen/teichoic acid export membrane protein